MDRKLVRKKIKEVSKFNEMQVLPSNAKNWNIYIYDRNVS